MRVLALALALWWGWFDSSLGWAQTLSRSEVEGAVEMRLHALLEGTERGLYVSRLTCPTDLKLADGAVTWELAPGVERWEAGRHTLPVTVFVEGATAARVQVSVTLKQRIAVPVPARDLKRGEVIGSGDVVLRDLDLAAPLPDRLRDPQEATGKAINRDVREGQPLQAKWLEAPVVVKRGDRIRVTLIRGGLKIETTGVALQNGRIGEHIPLRNTESKTVYDAQIIAPGEGQVRSW
ncbi:MAG: flagellar basal body P-ring formation chaperone FlgA [Magnetococcus sp. MYC-9]